MTKKKPAKKAVKKTKTTKKPVKKVTKKPAKNIVVAPVVDSTGVVMITPVRDDLVSS